MSGGMKTASMWQNGELRRASLGDFAKMPKSNLTRAPMLGQNCSCSCLIASLGAARFQPPPKARHRGFQSDKLVESPRSAPG